MKRQNVRKALIIISFLLFPITIYYFSPVLIIQGISQGIITGSFILFGLLFILSLFLNRAFCGWICPAGGLQEICANSVSKRAKGGKRNLIKYIIWVPWVISIIMLYISSGKTKEVDVFYQTFYGISISEPVAYVIYYGIVGLIVIMSFVGGRRAFCHYLCWMAPFMVIGSKINKFIKIPAINLTTERNKCTNCGICTKNCAMSLPVSDMVQKGSMENSECILCGECVDKCPKGAIKYSFHNNSKTSITNKNYTHSK